MNFNDILSRLIWLIIGILISYGSLQLRVHHVMAPWPAWVVMSVTIFILGLAVKRKGAGVWLSVGLAIAQLTIEPINGSAEKFLGAAIVAAMGTAIFYLGFSWKKT